MTKISINLPEELSLRLRLLEDRLPQILELGMRELNASSQFGFKGAADTLKFLASLPSPEEIIALRSSKTLQNEIDRLLEKKRFGQLTLEEQQLWEKHQYLEHLIRIAKAKAYLKLKQKPKA